MRKFFGLYDKEEEKVLKEKIISFTGIPLKFVNFLEVHVDGKEFVHVTLIDDLNYKNKKDLVLLHGLAGSSLNYFKTFKKFSEQYRIIAVDLPGMGCSSRHEFIQPTFLEVEDFFVDKLKLHLNKFILCGHSFGGYISSLFTLRYNSMVESLILLSPVGLSSIYSEIISTRLEDLLQSMCFKIEKPPSSIFKIFGGAFGNYLFDYVCTENKFRGLTDKEEFQVNKNFLNLLLRNKTGSEKAIFKLFDKNLLAFKPITYNTEHLTNIPILVMYGGDDWCPKSHAEELKKLLPNNVEIDLVSDSGHLIYADNYKELTDKIILFLEKCSKGEYIDKNIIDHDLIIQTNLNLSDETKNELHEKCV